MYILICVLLAICVNRQRVVRAQEVNQECGSTCENGSKSNATASAPEAAAANTCPFWSGFADYISLRDGTIKALDVWRKLWNSGITLKLGIYKNYQNDTVLNVGFDKSAPSDAENEVGRTFGIRRRMQLFLLLPISFKLGIILTLLLVLTAMSAKTLLLGFVILLLLLNHTHGYAKLWGTSRGHELTDVHKNIHIHVHTLPEDHHHQQPYVEAWQASPANAYHV